MKLLNDRVDVDRFYGRLAAGPTPILMLDYDGTLAPFRVDLDEAIPYPGVRSRLTRIREETRTRLVLVSGRWSEDLIPLLGMSRLPEIWGCHGAERVYPDGAIKFVKLRPEAERGLEEARQWAVEAGLSEVLEHKPTSVAFHWRGLPEARASAIKTEVADRWLAAAASRDLVLREFDGGLELRLAGIDKGRAVRAILKEAEPDTPAAYLGDDLTDEEAFAAMPDHGLKVLVRKELRQTRADLWLVPPDDLLIFLDRWITSCG